MEKDKKVEEKAQVVKIKRKVVPEEEKHKKGRWIILLVFFTSLFFSYVFSLKRD